jgi:hypothetical protein
MPREAVTQTFARRGKSTTDSEWETLQRIGAALGTFEDGIGRDFRENCEKRYQQYRGFQKFRNEWTAAGPRDRDGVISTAKRTWGSQLHIPLTYRTIEHMVPAAIAHAPKLLYLPRQDQYAQNVRNVQLLVDSQMQQNDIELPLQDVFKSGLMYGLGVGKSLWREEYGLERKTRRSMFRPNSYVPRDKLSQTCTFNDPWFEDVDVFDFAWDAYGSDLMSSKWVGHRIWLGLDDCLARMKDGSWNTEGARAITEEELRATGSLQTYGEVWQSRMEASGFGSFQTKNLERGEQIHELWEWHDKQRVFCVLDRQWLVKVGESPCVGDFPFAISRPTKVPKQFVGIGEIEPLEHLQRELDTLRSQRRDAATIALCAGYAFDENAVDLEDLEFGPAAAIAVRNANPRDAIMPLQIKEPPGTSYQEEQIIRGDMDLVSGATDERSDTATTQTATEAQLVQAAVSKRIGFKSRRFEIEVVRTTARTWLKLNQRMILSPRDDIRQPEDGVDIGQAAAENRWQWFPIGPGELRGEFEIIPEGGSMAAENVQQNIQLAQMHLQLAENPNLDSRKPLIRALTLLGEKDPESWLKQQDPPVPPLALELLGQAGVPPDLIQFAIKEAQRRDPQLAPEQQGPPPEQVNQLMAGAPQ